jgi:ribonuclease-3
VSTDRLGHRFDDPDLLRRALTHRSAGSKNNERLEFLGDSLVNLIVADALFVRWPRCDEGELTRARAALVREASLAEIARTLQLGDRLELGPGELKSGGFRRDSILADALEAVVGAIYLDAGFEACRDVVLPWFEPMIAALPAGKTAKDAKTRLQEWVQARQQALPEYRLVSADGEDHDKTFNVVCVMEEAGVETPGTGPSRRQAEQAAAQAALDLIETTP